MAIGLPCPPSTGSLTTQFADLPVGQLKLGAWAMRASASVATTVSLVDPLCVRRNIDLPRSRRRRNSGASEHRYLPPVTRIDRYIP
jgi:hypothetical protein